MSEASSDDVSDFGASDASDDDSSASDMGDEESDEGNLLFSINFDICLPSIL